MLHARHSNGRPAWRLLAAALCAFAWCAAESATAQSGSRSTANRTTPRAPMSAKPIYQQTSPFLKPMGSQGRLPVAVAGHCIVSLRDKQKWVAGKQQYQAVLDGRLYWFAGRREHAMFVAAPIRYAPALGGDCPVTYAESNERKPGLVEYGLLHQQRLYFFVGAKERQQFQAEPAKFRDADLVDDGYCVVSRIEEGRRVPGMPKAVAVVGGLRYLLAGAHERAMFFSNPMRYGANPKAHSSGIPMPKTADSDSGATSPQKKIAEHLAQAGPLSEATSQPLSDEDDLLPTGPPMLKGLCPVSILEKDLWIRGNHKYRCQYDGQFYLMAGEAEQQQFLENPARFVPALSGNCVVTYREQGTLVRGNNEFITIYQNRLFLFASAEKKKMFTKETAKAFAEVDLANRGLCIVSQRESGKKEQGDPLYMAWHQGKRYLFVSNEQKEKFLADPETYLHPENGNGKKKETVSPADK